ncbi:50S ribosomal protein L25/general stress protein Ctc [Streptomyces xiaopingdaonensis]|uniref:50S ribosomal protein L25/general stress protein Ctc n=1 Tax=Streptomyces xiaopingdaonensis TaxID=1565415 RepID=UPI00031B8691|nr:50S ribosomal protein L25/general stress protein Ctc [Streptomyces xiaopingdaonensis]
MADVTLTATVRNEFGKGAARRLRREEKVPAVLYGHGADPVHVAIPSYDMMMALKNSNVLIDLDIEGKSVLCIPKAVQREAIRAFLIHVDLLTVKRGEKVNVDVPLHIEGDLGPGQHILEHVYNTLPIEAEATQIPETITVSVEGLVAGDSVEAKDITLPKGVSLTIEGDETVLSVLAAQAEEPAPEGEEGEGSAAE